MEGAGHDQRAAESTPFIDAFKNMPSPNDGVKLKIAVKNFEEMNAYLKAHPDIHFLDCTFTDILGRWHHCTMTTDHIDQKDLETGLAFDASSIALFERIENCDYVMKPDPTTCFVDPFAVFPTLHVTGSVFKADGQVYEKCPREILKRAVQSLRSSGVADSIMIGPEYEFFMFNSAQFTVNPHHMMFSLDGEEAYWNSSGDSSERFPSGFQGSRHTATNSASYSVCSTAANSPSYIGGGGGKFNGGHRANLKQGYMTSRPVDSMADIRSEMILTLEQVGIKTEKHHHEVATCQMELNVAPQSGIEAADNLQVLKYVVKNVAARQRRSATFMPKPLANDNGSGMHCNQSLWKNGKNLFFDGSNTAFHQMSETAMDYAAGILHHAPALLAFACPTTNSYRRLVPQFEAPIHLTYSAGNRSTAIRIPIGGSEKTKRLEFRSPDASGCPYLTFATMLLAGLDGIKRKLALPEMGAGNLFDTENPLSHRIRKSPVYLHEALDALEVDSEFLTNGGVFTEHFIKCYVEYKRKEIEGFRCAPHPLEFQLYYAS